LIASLIDAKTKIVKAKLTFDLFRKPARLEFVTGEFINQKLTKNIRICKILLLYLTLPRRVWNEEEADKWGI
jgi:hypothetical protein